jgi:hypothetical protein
MDSQMGRTKVRVKKPHFNAPLQLLSLALICALTALPCRGQDEPKKPEGKENPTFGLTGGQVLIGKLQEKILTISTRYGKLEIPFSEILRVRFSLRLSPQAHQDFDAALDRLRKKDVNALADLSAIGPGAYRRLVSERGLEEDESTRRQLAGLISEIETIEDIYLDGRDEITTGKFTVRGTIETEQFHVHRGPLKLEIPNTDLVYIAWGELETSRSWKVSSSHIESSNRALSTGYKLRKGQKFTLEASGTMLWQGRSFGPAGISNHTWNSRNMGCLQWRVGKQPWQLAGTRFNGRSTASGELQLSVHLTSSGTSSGSFRVKLKSRKK